MMNALRSFVAGDVDDGLWTGDHDDMIALHHVDGRFARLSASARCVVGHEPAALEGAPLSTIVAPGDRGLALRTLAAACYMGKRGRAQFRILKRDGSASWAEMDVWTDEKGRIRSIIRDLGQGRAGPPADGTEAAGGEQAAQNGYLADLSHEIRTPLNAVIGFAEMMKHETFGPLGHAKYEEYAGLIHKSGQHLLALVSDILDLSKIEAERYRLKPERVDLPGLVSDCVEMTRLGAEEAGLALSADLDMTEDQLMADPKVVRQIVLNLLSNAVKFTGEGRIEVRLRGDADNVWICVVDTGIGMSREQLGKIGRRFTAAQRDGVRGAKGSGLGLALCDALARLHGGTLRIASREGLGTRVSLRLPRTLPAADRPGTAADATDPEDIDSVFQVLGAELGSITARDAAPGAGHRGVA